MNVPEIFKNLIIDTWYKAFVYIGALLFIVTLFVEIKGITNNQLQLLSGGLFFIGTGEWKNWKTASWFKPPNVYTGPPALMSAKLHKPDALGLFFDIIGILLILIAIWSIVRINI